MRLLADAESALRAAEEGACAVAAAQRLAASELERLRPLMDRGVISRDAFDKALTQAQTTSAAKHAADFNVEAAGYELKSAQNLLEGAAGTVDEPIEQVPVRSPVTVGFSRWDTRAGARCVPATRWWR